MDLTDKQWEIIEPLFEPKRRKDGRGRPWRDPRDGRYIVRGLPAGAYRLAVFPDDVSDDWLSPTFLYGLVRDSLSIRLKDGERVAQDLRIAPRSALSLQLVDSLAALAIRKVPAPRPSICSKDRRQRGLQSWTSLPPRPDATPEAAELHAVASASPSAKSPSRLSPNESLWPMA